MFPRASRLWPTWRLRHSPHIRIFGLRPVLCEVVVMSRPNGCRPGPTASHWPHADRLATLRRRWRGHVWGLGHTREGCPVRQGSARPLGRLAPGLARGRGATLGLAHGGISWGHRWAPTAGKTPPKSPQNPNPVFCQGPTAVSYRSFYTRPDIRTQSISMLLFVELCLNECLFPLTPASL